MTIKIAVVGDIHDAWEVEDNLALKHLGVDLVLFVGDFGNESVEVVRTIASLDLPKAAIMGNHDAWYSASDWGRKRCPYDRKKEDRVQQQLDLLGAIHVGYSYQDFPDLGLSVVGSRPFSWGGSVWKNEDFLRDRYDVGGFEESTERIVTAAKQTSQNTILFIGHNGPTGLGDQPDDPCGKDWQPIGGDYGDVDFEQAIAQTKVLGKNIPLVTFGHMHHKLRHTDEQLRKAIFPSKDGTIYLNSASVPRIIKTGTSSLRNFSLVTLQSDRQASAKGDRVSDVSLIWVGDDFTITSQQSLYQPTDSLVQPA